MKFAIVGAGSIGLLIGSYIAEHGGDVTYWVRREEQARQLAGGVIRRNGTEESGPFPVHAVTAAEKLPPDALWIIAVKYDALEGILQKISNLPTQPDLLFIQNGIAHLELTGQYPLGRFSFATVEHGAGRIDDRTVKHNGVGNLTVAAQGTMPDELSWLQGMDPEHFPVTVHADAERLLMRKVLINCAINPLTAVLQVKNGMLVENPQFFLLFRQLCDELLSAFPEMQEELNFEDIASVCRRTADNRSSMLTDRLNGTPMEVETIVSAVLRMIGQRDGQAPFLRILERMLLGLDGSGHVR